MNMFSNSEYKSPLMFSSQSVFPVFVQFCQKYDVNIETTLQFSLLSCMEFNLKTPFTGVTELFTHR